MNVFYKASFSLLFVLFSMLSAQAQSSQYCISGRFAENDLYSQIAIVSHFDVLYGFNSNAAGLIDSLKLNIHYPNTNIDGLSVRPLVMMVHGGAYTSGSKADLNAYCEELARRGYVAATIDYRLGWNNTGACTGSIQSLQSAMYRSIQDVNAAIRFLVVHASQYAIDTNFIFLAGQSEGAMSVLHAAFIDDVEGSQLFPGLSSDLGGLHNATNTLVTSYSIKGIFNWCGSIIDTSIIDADEKIPVLSIHGLLDTTMPVNAGFYLSCSNFPLVYGPQAIQKRMTNLGICSETNFDAAGYHCIFPSLEPIVYIPAKFTCFFKNILCGNCATKTKTGYGFASCMDAAPTGISEWQQGVQISNSYNEQNHTLTVSGFLNSSGSIELDLYSITGERIAFLSNENISYGQFSKQIQLPFNLSKGVYLISGKIGANSFSKKIVE